MIRLIGVWSFASVLLHILPIYATWTHKVSISTSSELEAGGLANIHVEYHHVISGKLALYYGACESDTASLLHHSIGSTHVGSHPLAKRHLDWHDQRPTRFVWLLPENTPTTGCIHAFLDDVHVGVSSRKTMTKRKAKRAMFADVADPMGPWFDGVQYLKQKEPDEVFVASVKSKSFGIIGGGMSGLMTAVSQDRQSQSCTQI
jgi:hypothetical protein